MERYHRIMVEELKVRSFDTMFKNMIEPGVEVACRGRK